MCILSQYLTYYIYNEKYLNVFNFTKSNINGLPQNISDISDTRKLGQKLAMHVIALKMGRYKRRLDKA